MGLGERAEAHDPVLLRLARWARRKWPVAALVVLLAAGVAGAATWAVMRYTHPPTLIGAVVTPPVVAPDQTREVWARYYVGSDAKEVNPEAVRVGPPSPDLVAHSALVYVIDPKVRHPSDPAGQLRYAGSRNGSAAARLVSSRAKA